MRMASQVNQNAIRKATAEWKAYFKALDDYKAEPWKYKARPRAPSYIRKETATAWFTNQVAKLHEVNGKHVISFVKSNIVIPVGRLTGKYIKTEVQPWHGGYRILVTTDDDVKEPAAPSAPKRILGIDTGIDNLAAVANNY